MKWNEREPPLTLTFRQAPEKVGYLTKMVNVSKENPKWKSRFFILSEGKLAYKKENSSDSHIRDGTPIPMYVCMYSMYIYTSQLECGVIVLHFEDHFFEYENYGFYNYLRPTE